MLCCAVLPACTVFLNCAENEIVYLDSRELAMRLRLRFETGAKRAGQEDPHAVLEVGLAHRLYGVSLVLHIDHALDNSLISKCTLSQSIAPRVQSADHV